MNYGFVKPKLDETQYRSFGGLISLPTTILQANGDWTPYLPKYERQFNENFDTYGCTVFGTLNCFETLFKKKTGKDYDFSERYIYNIARVEPPGHDPHDIAEKIRKEGLIDQSVLPMTSTLEEFAKPRPMTQEIIDKGHLLLERYGLKHEWVYTEDLKDIYKRHQLIREHLKYSPLGISVTAWNKNDEGEYASNGESNTHWCMAFMIDEKDRVHVFDSYDQEIKILTPDHDIQFVKRYYIEQKSVETQNKNILKSFISLLQNFYVYMVKNSKLFGEALSEVANDLYSNRR